MTNIAQKKLASILVGVLLLASMMEFVVRGPLRLLYDGLGWNDFLSPYIQAKAWAHGEDPYSPQSLINGWPSDISRPPFVDSDAKAGILERKRGMPSPYPLSTFVILLPFSALPWPVALSLWSALSIAAVILAVLSLPIVCGYRLQEMHSQIFIVAALALAPFHTGLATGNPAMLAVSLVAGTVWANQMHRQKTAGALLALAICLKPTVAGGLLLYYLIRRRWIVAATCCGLAGVISVVGLARMAIAGTSWLSSYLQNSQRMFATGSVDDFTRTVVLRFNMINSQVFFGGLFSSGSTVKWLAQMLGVVLLTAWIFLCFRRRTRTGMHEISAVSILSLVAVYHRFYDATLLIFPLAWSLLLVSKRATSIATLATIAPFLIPGPIVLADLASSGRIPLVITRSWWWNAVILPHEAWDLILLTVLLLYFLWRESPESSLPAQPA